MGRGGFEPPKPKAPDCDWRDVRYLDTSNISNQTHFLNGYVHYYSQAHLTTLEPTQFFNLKYVKDHVLKKSLQIYKQFFNIPNIFQYFFVMRKGIEPLLPLLLQQGVLPLNYLMG